MPRHLGGWTAACGLLRGRTGPPLRRENGLEGRIGESPGGARTPQGRSGTPGRTLRCPPEPKGATQRPAAQAGPPLRQGRPRVGIPSRTGTSVRLPGNPAPGKDLLTPSRGLQRPREDAFQGPGVLGRPAAKNGRANRQPNPFVLFGGSLHEVQKPGHQQS
jgi:hypothetical protein